jgi:hypothetical protein
MKNRLRSQEPVRRSRPDTGLKESLIRSIALVLARGVYRSTTRLAGVPRGAGRTVEIASQLAPERGVRVSEQFSHKNDVIKSSFKLSRIAEMQGKSRLRMESDMLYNYRTWIFYKINNHNT